MHSILFQLNWLLLDYVICRSKNFLTKCPLVNQKRNPFTIQFKFPSSTLHSSFPAHTHTITPHQHSWVYLGNISLFFLITTQLAGQRSWERLEVHPKLAVAYGKANRPSSIDLPRNSHYLQFCYFYPVASQSPAQFSPAAAWWCERKRARLTD